MLDPLERYLKLDVTKTEDYKFYKKYVYMGISDYKHKYLIENLEKNIIKCMNELCYNLDIKQYGIPGINLKNLNLFSQYKFIFIFVFQKSIL
jgi:hypothetical protein